MSEDAKTRIGNFVTMLLTLLFSIPSVAALFPAGTLAKLLGEIGPVLSAVSALITFALLVWSLLPFSKAKKVALAAELPQVSRVVATDPLAREANALLPGGDTVVTHREALKTMPPAPTI